MAIVGTFIGVDRYADANISDLGGARRDAEALWSLFSDTFAGMDARLMVDDEATSANVLDALSDRLGKATSDETVIISISCHGTRDHRLALHDTRRDDLPSSTISMEKLSTLFKGTRARAVLCVLDCCFSGGAPARVIDDSPIARDPDLAMAEIAGTGRILLAASGVNEPALELPSARHGLLTKVLMDVLRSSEKTVSLTSAADRIMQLVRTEAARMGYTQTPVMLGHVEGGLVMPALKPGRNFFSCFPELRGLRIGSQLAELSGFGIPDAIIDAWTAQHSGTEINPLQQSAINEHRILDGDSLLVVAPTTSGKTFVGEMAAARAVVGNRKAVFLFPYKALVNEKYEQFRTTYAEKLAMRIIRCTGDYQDQTSALFRGKYDIAVLTYETFLNLALSNPSVLNQIGLVVVDEAQFITDPKRGIVVELVFTHLLAARERGVCPQMIALSAVIGDVNDFDAWLAVSRLVTKNRPVPLIEGVLDRSGVFEFLDLAGKRQTTQLVPAGNIVQRKSKASSQDVIVPLVKQLLISPDERVVVFRNQRGSAQGCANYLAQDLGLPPAAAALAALPLHDRSTASDTLRACLEGGTAFHTSDLSREEREIVECEFRKRGGEVKALAATTTIAAGVNTPASTVILAEQEFLGDEGRPFTIAEYKNMAGRAGRLGYQEEGRSIVLAENAFDRTTLFQRYVLGSPEPLRSSFVAKDIETWLIRLLAQGGCISRQEIPRLLANTYAGFLNIRSHPEWRGQMEHSVAQIIPQLLEQEIVDEEDGVIQLTLLGKACGRSSLSFSSCQRLIRMLKGWQGELTAEALMVLVQGLPEMDDVYTPVMKRGQTESRWPGEVSRQFGALLARTLQRNVSDDFAYYARCKRAMILHQYISGVSMSEIEEDATANAFAGKIGAGTVRSIADATRFHLSSAWKIAILLLVGSPLTEERIDSLLKQLEMGIPEEALELLTIPVSLNRGELLALHTAGIISAKALWAAPVTTVRSLLGTLRGADLERVRPAS